MMRFSVDCNHCAEVVILSRFDIAVMREVSKKDTTYRFTCPECNAIVTKDCNEALYDLLINAGVKIRLWTMPAELYEPHTGEALTYDDLLQFHNELESMEALS